MSKTLSTTLVVLTLLHIVLSQQFDSCKSVSKTPCSYDAECLCNGNVKLICNYDKKCKQESLLDKIIRRQPCYPVFKSRCITNDDCPCQKIKLVCEDRECVKEKPWMKARSGN